jgi:MscS family membrane protein
VRELVEQHPYTRKDYYHVYLNDFGDSALQVLLYVFFKTPDWATELRERHRLGVDIVALAARLGVEIAFPTRTVFLRHEQWSPAESAGDGYPEARDRLSTEARATARQMVHDAVGDTVPPPVSFAEPTTETRGNSDSGD